MEIRWINRGRMYVEINGRVLNVGGEAMLNHNPDYLIYARYVGWEDGGALAEEDKAALLDDVVQEAAKRDWKFEIDW